LTDYKESREIQESPPPAKTERISPAMKAAIQGNDLSNKPAEPIEKKPQADLPAPAEAEKINDAPRELYTLADGRQVNITGDLHRFKNLNHQQGEVPDFKGTCGLCSVQCMAGEFGKNFSEADVVRIASNKKPPACNIHSEDPGQRGGTNPEDRVRTLGSPEIGIPANVETDQNFKDLSRYIDRGYPVNLSVKSGYLWGEKDPGSFDPDPKVTDHSVTLIDVAHDPNQDDMILGFFINDSGNNIGGKGSGRFVDVPTMKKTWLDPGGKCVVGNISHADKRTKIVGNKLDE
jgi:hypothetical protein